jgi:hypothetical protein
MVYWQLFGLLALQLDAFASKFNANYRQPKGKTPFLLLYAPHRFIRQGLL